MSRVFQLYQVDAFTTEKFTGNPAGVITNADGLSVDEMQRIARELNHSETAFLFASKEDAYDVWVRFFTPLREVPICGHATVAAHYVRAREQGLRQGRVLQKTGVGILPVDIVPEEEDLRIVMTQSAVEFQPALQGGLLQEILAALTLSSANLQAECPVQIVSTGHGKVMVGIRDRELLHRLSPNMEALKAISKVIGCNGFYVFAMNAPDAEILVHGRMFAPAMGIPEDPVTGNANGPLGAYLIHHRLVPYHGSDYTFRAVQGEAMKRPGQVTVQVEISRQEPVQVRISGRAVVVFQTELNMR